MKAAAFTFAMLLAAFAVEAQPVITQQPTNQIALGGSTTTFSVSVSGTGPFSYQWQFNGSNLPPSGIITTVAGGGTSLGDGGAATNAALNDPSGVAVDANDNLFIADAFNCRVRKVDTLGMITTVAGNGNNTYTGDGGTATNTGLGVPIGVALDASGNLFIADDGVRICKVKTNGIITTVAGNGNSSFSGDGGAATNAGINPDSVVVDAGGNLFIADRLNNRIRKVDTNGIITTVAGNGNNSYSGDGGAATNAGLYWPMGVAVNVSGNLFIADYYHYCIRKINTNGVITTVAGNGNNSYSGDGGAATNAGLVYPQGVAVDTGGDLFIAEEGDGRIRKVDTNGIITTVAGNGSSSFSGDGGAATNAALHSPVGVAVDAVGNLFIADYANSRIRKVAYPYFLSLSSLILNNVSTKNAGNYSVIIAGSSGSVTSSVVTLTVLISPSITAPTLLANGHFQISFDTTTGVDYAVQSSTNLMQWFPFVTLGGIGVPLTVIDPNTSGSQQRFYRIVLSPQ